MELRLLSRIRNDKKIHETRHVKNTEKDIFKIKLVLENMIYLSEFKLKIKTRFN